MIDYRKCLSIVYHDEQNQLNFLKPKLMLIMVSYFQVSNQTFLVERMDYNMLSPTLLNGYVACITYGIDGNINNMQMMQIYITTPK